MSQRKAIIQMYCAGKTNPQILKFLEATKLTLRDAVMRYKELETCSDQPRCGRPRNAHTQCKIIVIKERIRRNSNRSMRKMARSLEVDEKSVEPSKEGLKLFPLKMKSRQQLTALQKQKRLERSKVLWNAMKNGTFTVEAIFNSQNDRILTKSADSISTSVKSVFRRQKVWATISKIWQSSLIFAKEGAKSMQTHTSTIF